MHIWSLIYSLAFPGLITLNYVLYCMMNRFFPLTIKQHDFYSKFSMLFYDSLGLALTTDLWYDITKCNLCKWLRYNDHHSIGRVYTFELSEKPRTAFFVHSVISSTSYACHLFYTNPGFACNLMVWNIIYEKIHLKCFNCSSYYLMQLK